MKTPAPRSGSPIFAEIHSHTVGLSINLFTLGFRDIEAACHPRYRFDVRHPPAVVPEVRPGFAKTRAVPPTQTG